MKECRAMKAHATEDIENYMDDENWVFERKFDGTRAILIIKDHKVKIMGRGERAGEGQSDYTDNFPEVVREILPVADMTLDGELIYEKDGVEDFSIVAGRVHRDEVSFEEAMKIPCSLVLFDIINYRGVDFTNLPWSKRREQLPIVFHEICSKFDGQALCMTEYASNRSEKEMLMKACIEKGWEGVMLKDINGIYEYKRSRNWLKYKFTITDDVIVTGFTEGTGKRKDFFGALTIAQYNKEGDLVDVGKVGGGFDDSTLAMLMRMINKNDIPFVIEVKGYGKRTKNGCFRHPEFLRLRPDKPAKECIYDEE